MIDASVPPFTSTEHARLLEVTNELAAKHRELALLAQADKEGRVAGYFRSEEKSVQARDREAEYQVLNVVTDMIRLKGEIKALEVEHQTLLAWMEC